jgi:protein-tyrosine phosphatase
VAQLDSASVFGTEGCRFESCRAYCTWLAVVSGRNGGRERFTQGIARAAESAAAKRLEAMKTVLFLCTGNYYRSRFAEAFFNWHAEQLGIAWRAVSRGLELHVDNVGPMSAFTRARLAEHAIDCGPYDRLPLDASDADFASADHVVAVKRTEHHHRMQRRFPQWIGKVEFWEVHDLDCATPQEAMPHLEREVLALLNRLSSGTRSGEAA